MAEFNERELLVQNWIASECVGLKVKWPEIQLPVWRNDSDMEEKLISLVKTEINETTGTCSLYAKWKILLLNRKIK